MRTPSRPRSLATRTLAGATALLLALALGATGTAVAGGWAVSTLDELPTPTAGETVDVGFTIRQHGVTPIDLDPTDPDVGDVGIEIAAPGGAERFFPAEPSGTVGHYVATVEFPEAGEYRWAVRQGWFAEHDLGSIAVAAGGSGGIGVAAVVRIAVAAVAALLALVALADLVATRRRRVQPA